MPIPSVPKLILANLLVGLIIYLSGGSLGCFPPPSFRLVYPQRYPNPIPCSRCARLSLD